MTYLSFDPGLVNCCCALVKPNAHGDDKASVLWTETWNLSSGSKPDAESARAIGRDVKRALLFLGRRPRAVVEYQPPLRNGGIAIVRYNCWVEGYLVAMLQGLREEGLVEGEPIVVHPSACKQHWKIRSGEYAVNKSLAKSKAQVLLDGSGAKITDHAADCVLNALYAHVKK